MGSETPTVQNHRGNVHHCWIKGNDGKPRLRKIAMDKSPKIILCVEGLVYFYLVLAPQVDILFHF